MFVTKFYFQSRVRRNFTIVVYSCILLCMIVFMSFYQLQFSSGGTVYCYINIAILLLIFIVGAIYSKNPMVPMVI
jgi:glycopeptide antibiotics resistance protein